MSESITLTCVVRDGNRKVFESTLTRPIEIGFNVFSSKNPVRVLEELYAEVQMSGAQQFQIPLDELQTALVLIARARSLSPGYEPGEHIASQSFKAALRQVTYWIESRIPSDGDGHAE